MSREGIVEQIKSLLARTMPAGTSAFLFGSQARGDFSGNSDWDLLILFDGEQPITPKYRGELALPFYILGAELGIEINPIFYTLTEWKKRNFTPFYKNVNNDSIKIWG